MRIRPDRTPHPCRMVLAMGGAMSNRVGPTPKRGCIAAIVVSVRLTPQEAAALDALGPSRGESLRRLLADRAVADAINDDMPVGPAIA